MLFRSAIPTPPAIQVPHREMTYTWRYVPGPLTNLIALSNDFYGFVNDAPFDAAFLGLRRDGVTHVYPPNTVMYLGMEEQPILATPAGNRGLNRLYDVPHKFVAMLKGPTGYPGWNSVYRPNLGVPPGDWDTARNRKTGGPPYGQKDFTQLFQV